jgi:hypothetical protein
VAFLITASLLFAILIVAGGVWLVRSSAERPRASGATAGPQGAPSAMGRLKASLRAGEWSRALPSLLVIAGLLGVMHFGALALIFVFHRPGAGIPMLLVALFAAARIALDYYRA